MFSQFTNKSVNAAHATSRWLHATYQEGQSAHVIVTQLVQGQDESHG